MRRLVVSEFLTLDGIAEAPQEWNPPYFNDEMGAELGQAMASADAFLLGRVTYEEWAAFWPSQSADENPMAGFINNATKYVVSTSLSRADWANSRLIKGDLAAEVAKLKAEDGKDIIVSGSITLVRSLLAEKLVDRLQLLVHPIIVRKGRQLFDDPVEQTTLALVESNALSTGVVSLTYER
jgi:dihydrofolate reductase